MRQKLSGSMWKTGDLWYSMRSAFRTRYAVCPSLAPAMMQMLGIVFGKNFRRTLTLADSLDMNRMLDETVDRPVKLQYIPSDHELYRSFLYVDLAGNEKIPLTDEKCQNQPTTHMEGIWRDRKLILVYNEYNDYRHDLFRIVGDRSLVLNLLIYTLTQPGGKTQHLVDASTVTSQKSRKFWDYREPGAIPE